MKNFTALPANVHVLERGWLSANNIIFTGGPATVMVDSGYCTHAPQTLWLVENILGQSSLDLLVNTHLHSDHCGGNAALQKRYPLLQTWIPPGEASAVTRWDVDALSYSATGQHCPRFVFNRVMQAGTEIDLGGVLWQIHAAPGHDPHSVIFFEPKSGVLISADTLWENGFGVVFPELEGDNAFGKVQATLNLIAQLEPKTVIPGHGPVFQYSPEVMQRAQRRLDAFTSNPKRHARHAAKVLIKFKLLDVQRQTVDKFRQWAEQTPYFEQTRNRFFDDVSLTTWLEQLCGELQIAGVASIENGEISNR